MYVKQLSLNDYRNYEELELTFHPGIHLFIGDNAQGKTNLLEALYVLALAKSHRTSKDRELIRHDQKFAAIKGLVEKRQGILPLELYISNKGKKAKVNHLEQGRLSNYIGSLNVVMFAPEDLELVKGSPQVRRRFIDMEIGQISPMYLYYLSQYNKLLHQRNALLKDWKNRLENRPLIEVFTSQLVSMAAKILVQRDYFIRLLESWAGPIHEQIAQGKEKLEIIYQYSTPVEGGMSEEEIVQVLTTKFEEIREREEERGITLIGPHRDDLQFKVNGFDVHSYGSQGQQRTTALSLKLAEIELIKAEIGEFPILLLDDVLSELDDTRRALLLKTIENKVQTFVTNTSLEGTDWPSLQQTTIYQVHQGKITLLKGE